MKTKRIILIVVLSSVLLFILFCVGRCAYKNYNYEKHFDEMYALSYETIPGYDYISGHQGAFVFLDKDQYGRYMYRVSLYPLPGIPEGYNYALIIVQAEDKDAGMVYYYEGQSTAFVHYTSFRSTDEDKAKIEELKKQNDWGKPLQKDKMAVIPVSKYPYPDTHLSSDDATG